MQVGVFRGQCDKMKQPQVLIQQAVQTRMQTKISQTNTNTDCHTREKEIQKERREREGGGEGKEEREGTSKEE